MAPVQTLGSAEGSIEINEATEEKCSFSRRERVCVCIVGWPSCKVPYMYVVIDLCPAGMDVVGLNFSAVSAKQVMAIELLEFRAELCHVHMGSSPAMTHA